jgi:hypothetical protein
MTRGSGTTWLRSRGGKVFVRGYGLQESTSFWEFTPTRARPLEGSFWLTHLRWSDLDVDAAELTITGCCHPRASPQRD